ncbi:octopamine receptor Oamb isoform X1 [Uranotaenia lowii]|uniref:octopamine receptor Oamb isoform X1 n=1 Tax=Uranotaenia lowii TaxID=190385 RepID=UPI0024799833|nr:octopamine receptor Oamb isoform X1 [Uranotaenia lowii]XP_055609889.1 octopamine receptor Oamb isoform X1 [Uranotaenia lowii]XP_055609896.1 octopamine receptor Oamb isoform X1 [Uranotaenia lowii]XP_055609900.1 octopamine receptor Oamb isoform X1 [Uranotaenia lowii]XP_055609907.1 octopamine receptor Oamb isoform X1 [Uranotaenia lowii]XP_055609913.1 octopamine receptor Oamb isoform X1 [Uranotaenia lowii]XP_055609920.1 octopamine receptor Oamb isoform X1 [Uranotaenia lowii]XP_055609926.1 oct
MNATQCDSMIASVEWTEPRKILLLAILIFIDILVIVGNTLVVAAVTSSHKLRSVTNFFIVSLAVADLLVGIAVLPFSATWEVFKVWIFGNVWCRVWLAVDVWMCTASILNLCAISLDRYVAVTRPVTYPSIMSTGRAKSLIAGLWVLSFVICFPPLVGWKEQKVKENLLYQYGNHTPSSSLPASVSTVPTSMLSANASPSSSSFSSNPYSSYSSSSSPTHSSPLSAFVSSSSSSSSTPWPPDDGGYSSMPPGFLDDLEELAGAAAASPLPVSCPWTCELTNDAGYVVYSALGSFYIPMFVMLFFYWRIYRAAERTTRAINQGFRTTKGVGNRFDDNRLTLRIHRGRGSTASAHGPPPGDRPTIGGSQLAIHESSHSNGDTHSTATSLGSASPERLSRYLTRNKNQDKIKISVSYPSTENLNQSSRGESGESSKLLYAVHYSSNGRKESTVSQIFRRPSKDKSGSSQYLTVDGGRGLLSPRSSKRMGKRNIKAQVKRFRMETKAAKTLAIIVGLFILCWLPFFTMYLIQPFCDNCINDLLFSIAFWIGYCNSAINPMIYALFSKDFRFAFKRLICRFFCSAEAIPRPTSRRGSDMSQIRGHHGGRTPSISPSAAAQSIGDDSDPMVGDLSDSR